MRRTIWMIEGYDEGRWWKYGEQYTREEAVAYARWIVSGECVVSTKPSKSRIVAYRRDFKSVTEAL